MSNTLAGEYVGAEVAPISDIDFGAAHVRTTSDGPRLIGCRCDACGTLSFPKRSVCFACGNRGLTEELLTPQGKLYSFTVVHVSSSRPVPYTIGYIDLDDGVRLLATISGEPEALRPDIPVILQAEDTGFSFHTVDMGAAV